MSQEYKYAGDPLSEIAAMDLLKNRYTPDTALTTGHSLKNLIHIAEQQHVKNGGLPTDDSDALAVLHLKVRSYLLASGHATELIGGNLILPKNGQRIFGKGSDWVYCYYLNSQKEEGESRYPCTIGLTRSDSIKSVTEYIEKQMRKAVVERPKIPLLFRTDGCVDLEGAIHRILRLRGQQIDAPGNELFNTNPKEVLQIYDFIVHGDSHYTRKRESISVKRAERARVKPHRDTRRAAEKQYSETQESHLRFWTGLGAYIAEKGNSLKFPTPGPWRYIVWSIGRTGFHIETHLVPTRNEISIRLCVNTDNPEADFYRLQEQQDEIHNAFGEALQWNELPGNKRSRIGLTKIDTDPSDESDWPQQFEWFTTKLERFNQVFRERIRVSG